MARTLAVEVEVLQLSGQLPASEFDALLVHPQLRIEAHYQPTKLIDGVTARRERIMPIGSKLFEIGQITTLTGTQIVRQGRTLRFTAEDAHPAHVSYRLNSLLLAVPIAPGPGRPQPDLQIQLVNPLNPKGAHAVQAQQITPAFELQLCVRYRWSDTPPEQTTPTVCTRPY